MPRLILTSDTHTMHDQLVMPAALPGDIFLHAGDFSYQGRVYELEAFELWLSSLDYDHKIMIAGNHDLSFETKPKLAYRVITTPTILDQTLVEVEGISIYGEPRQPEFFNWAFNVPRHKMKEVWDKVPTSIDVLLTHGPPYRAGDMNQEGDSVGCVYLREWIEKHQPKLVVCGHIHEGYGSYYIGKTQVVNASACTGSYKITNPPVVVEL